MRIHNNQRQMVLPFFAALLGVILPSILPAQARHIVLITDSQGRAVYINTSGQEPAQGVLPSSPRSLNSSSPDAPEGIQRLVKQTANRFKIDPRLVDAVIQTESGYDSHAVSSKGALGLMQLIPATAERFGVENPFDPGQNIKGGVRYLRYLLDLFNGNVRLSLAAYNAGEHSVLREGGIPRFPETVDYVRKVTALYGVSGETGGAPSEAPSPQPPSIYRYADTQGVVHFTNDGGF